ncbi:MAG: FecR domain-containing protein, partial [Gammaproteobacteria bacterium]|nr:FecR domain-containing protein [Gammaproteobacteria bacterium]
MKNYLVIFCLFFGLGFSSPGFTKQGGDIVKIGEITTYTGQVLVRSKGKWMKLVKAPFPIYSTDKVVTKRGRAQVHLVGTGVLRMDTDSNITITQRIAGKLTKRKVTSRQVNVLVGNVLFDVKLKKGGSKFRVRTPTMTAAIRGTTMPIKVGADGNTEYDINGDATITGGRKAYIPAQSRLSAGEIKVAETALPQTNAEVDKLPIQQSASKAVNVYTSANRSLMEAEAKAEKAGKVPVKQADAAAAKGAAHAAFAQAGVAGASAVLDEAKRLSVPVTGKTVSYYANPTHSIMAKFLFGLIPVAYAQPQTEVPNETDAKAALDAAKTAAEGAEAAAQQAAKAAEATKNASTPVAAVAAAAAAIAAAAAAEANAQVAGAAETWARASGTGNEAVKTARTAAKSARASATQARTAAATAGEQAKAASDAAASGNRAAAQAAAAAAQATASAATANASAAGANADVAGAGASGDADAAAAAQTAADAAEASATQSTEAATASTKQAVAAADAKTKAAAQAAASAAEATAAAATANASVAEANADVAGASASGNTAAAKAA